MSPEVSERRFEEAIECGLLQDGPDACAGDTTVVRETPLPYGDTLPDGYRKRSPEDYDRALCLLPRDARARPLLIYTVWRYNVTCDTVLSGPGDRGHL